MPRGAAPDRYGDILQSKALGHMATLGPDGHPQVNPVWFLSDGAQVFLSVRPETQKYKNLRLAPHLAISVIDPTNPMRYVELRGEVIDWELFLDLTFVNQLAHKYTGSDYTRGHPGEERYKVTVRVDAWSGQG